MPKDTRVKLIAISGDLHAAHNALHFIQNTNDTAQVLEALGRINAYCTSAIGRAAMLAEEMKEEKDDAV